MADTTSGAAFAPRKARPNAALPPDRRAPRSADDPDAGDDAAEYLEIDNQGDYETEIAPDGSLIVTIDEPYENPQVASDEFYENLVLLLPRHILDRIGTEMLRYVEEDKEAREKRDKQRAEAIQRSNLGNEAPGGAEFDGASRAAHPIIAETAIDFEARVMKELWPPAGPVKQRIVGSPTRQKTERAKRKVEHMNWQLTSQIKEAYSTLETSILQSAMGGGAYLALNWDGRLERPKITMLTVDRVWLPYGATDFYSSHRKTYSETISEVEFRHRVDGRMYADLDIPTPAARPEETSSEKASAKVQGKTDPGMNLDGDREIFTIAAYLEVDDETADVLAIEKPQTLYPYLIMVDGGETGSKKVVGLYRNWEPNDKTREAIDHIFEIPFIPWEGGYSIGLAQIIGSLSGAATGALRAILDSGFVRTVPGGLILKGSSTTAQTRRPKVGEFTEIDTGLEAQDIRQRVMQFTTGPADPQLFQILGFIVNAARECIRTTVDETAPNQNPNQPVGTRLSVVEEGLVVFSQIHGRVHQAFNRFLTGLHRLNRLYLPRKLSVDADGKEILVWQRDYQGPMDIQPVSDPTVFSEQQRYAQDLAIQARATQVPQLYKARAVEERWLRRQKIGEDEIKQLLADAPQPHELNAANENLAMGMATPVVVFPEQDHLAHIETHLQFLENPLFGSNPLIAPRFVPAALKHIADHFCFAYVSGVHDMVSRAAGMEATLLLSNDSQVKRRLDQLLALASDAVLKRLSPILQRAQPILQTAMQMAQQMAPKPPMDPATAAVQASLAETQRKTAADQSGAAQNAAELQSKNQIAQGELAAGWARIQAMVSSAQLAAQTKVQTTDMDNETAEDIASSRVAAGSAPGYSTGESLRGGAE